MIQSQILQTRTTRIVWQTVRRITNKILGVKGSCTHVLQVGRRYLNLLVRSDIFPSLKHFRCSFLTQTFPKRTPRRSVCVIHSFTLSKVQLNGGGGGGGGIAKETVVLRRRESITGNLVLTTELKT